MQGIEQGARYYGVPMPAPGASEEEDFKFAATLLSKAIGDEPPFMEDVFRAIAQ